MLLRSSLEYHHAMHSGTWRSFVHALVMSALASCAWAETAASGKALPDRLLGPPFTLRSRASLGPDEAAVIVIEITDFRCEHCRQFHERVFPRIKQRYVDTGLVRYIALPAAQAGETPAPAVLGVARHALALGKFWDVRGALFAHAQERDVAGLARKIGLDPAAATAGVRAAETQAAVAADAAEVAALEIPGTPTFVVRRRLARGGFVEARVEGYESWDHFNTLLTDMLQREEP